MNFAEYQLKDFINNCYFGKVHLTEKEGDQKKYATKVIERSALEKNEEVKRYYRTNLLFLKNLQHPNIIKLIDIKKSKKNYYIIMELCNGGKLSKALEKYKEKNGKAFPEELVQHFMRQIIDAFKYLHEKKIIHRNINLYNILLNFENEEDKQNFNLFKAQIKITDFGFACKYNENIKINELVGTPLFLNPFMFEMLEACNKKIRKLCYDLRYDIWPIGEICYEMLIGKPVFDSEDLEDYLDKIKKGNYTVPGNTSAELISFLNGMLQYEEKNRLNAEQLSQHNFLTKNVKEFNKINLDEIDNKIEDNKIEENTIENKASINKSIICFIHKGNKEMVLSDIKESDFIKSNDKKEDLKQILKNSIKQLQAKNESENMKNQEKNEIKKEDMDKLEKEKNIKEDNFSFTGDIFDN